MSDHDGLSLRYRIGWRLRKIALSLFGPATLGDDDPQLRLDRERADRAAQARSRRRRGPR